GDLALGADRDQGVEAGLEQAPGVLRVLLLGGHVPGGGEDTEHVAARVLVYGRVVEHVVETAVLVPDGQRVVGDEAPGEDLLVALTSLVRLGEVVREVSPNQLF